MLKYNRGIMDILSSNRTIKLTSSSIICPKVQSRFMSSGFPLSLFYKLTSQKPIIRTHVLCKEKDSLPNSSSSYFIKKPNKIPVWYKLNNNISSFNLLQALQRSTSQSSLRVALYISKNKSLTLNLDSYSKVTLTSARWQPITSKIYLGTPILRVVKILFMNLLGPLQLSQYKNRMLATVLTQPRRFMSRPSFPLLYGIKYSCSRDIRFVLFLLIFLGFTIWICLAPDLLLNKPMALCSPDIKLLIKCIKDTYVKHICSSHPEVLSPCDCGEPLNKCARDMFPQTSFDPLKIENQEIGKMKTISVMVATIILSIALVESISPYGVYIEV